ncbi:unnamed protein product, partial [Staurois parvus]
MTRSEDLTGRDGWMAEQVQSQTDQVGYREDGTVQGSGQRIVGSHARSATAERGQAKQGSGQENIARSEHNPSQQLTIHRFADTGYR